MRQTDVDPPDQGLGDPIRPLLPEPMVPKLKPLPGHPAHESNGTDVRLKPGATAAP